MEVDGRENHQYEESSQWFVTYLKRQGDWLEKTRGNLMVVATVIAAMSFQAMVNPPGGVWQIDDCSSGNQTGSDPNCKATAGTAVLEDHDSSKRVIYLGMVVSCTVSFTASMSLILLVISGLRLRNRLIMAILITFMVAAVLCTSAAFFFAVLLVQSENKIIGYIMKIYLGFWIVFPVLILLIQLVRLIRWLICFVCCLSSTSTTAPSTVAAFGSVSCLLMKMCLKPTFEMKIVSAMLSVITV